MYHITFRMSIPKIKISGKTFRILVPQTSLSPGGRTDHFALSHSLEADHVPGFLLQHRGQDSLLHSGTGILPGQDPVRMIPGVHGRGILAEHFDMLCELPSLKAADIQFQFLFLRRIRIDHKHRQFAGFRVQRRGCLHGLHARKAASRERHRCRS